MNKNKISKLLSIVCIAGLLISGCGKTEKVQESKKIDNNEVIEKALSVNSLDKMKNKNLTIDTKIIREYKDKTKEEGNTKVTINNNQNPAIIKADNKGDSGSLVIYMVNKGAVADIYTSSSDNDTFNLSKDVPIKDLPYSFYDFGFLNIDKSNYKVIGEEKIGDKDTIKISCTKKSDDLLSEDVLNMVKNAKDTNKEAEKILSNMDKGIVSYYWLDSKTYEVVKFVIDNTALENLLSNMGTEPNKNPLTKSTLSATVEYKADKLEIPKKVAQPLN